MLKVTARTLRRWCKKGYLKARYTDRKKYFSRKEIDALINSNAIQENGKIDKSFLEHESHE